jgi:hypothetical protein
MNRLNTTFFLVLLLVFIGFVTLFPPDERVIESENRSFNLFPELTIENVFGGGFGKQFDGWLSDRVGYRVDLAATSRAVAQAGGIAPPMSTKVSTSESISALGYITQPPQLNQLEPPYASDVPNIAPIEDPLPVIQPEGIGRIDGVLLTFDDRIMEIFTENPQLGVYYAETINAYRAALDKDVRVFSLLVPTQIEFLSERYKNISDSQRKTTDMVNSLFAEGVKTVDVYSEIALHVDEYVYFRSDHHWTALGAYYAYTVFAREAGFEPLALDEYEEIEFPGFLGFLYNLAPSESLQKKPDTIYAYRYNGELETSDPLLFLPGPDGKAAYAIFLGGDRDSMTITTSVKNGRTAIVIKDSYANCFVPWLAPHYERIVVLDPRTYEGSALEQARQYGDVDMIFVNYILTTRFEHIIDFMQKIK